VLAAAAAVTLAASADYTVERGDTLSVIAANYGMTVTTLAEANGVTNPDLILAGTTLRIPGNAASASDEGSSASSAASDTTHSVARGENLTTIARRYGVTVRALMEANDLGNPDHILAGSTLRVDGTAAPSPTAGSNGSATASPASSSAPLGSLSRAEAGDLIERVAIEHGWNPAFVKALAWQESGWRNDVVSHAGARGIMQVMPGTGSFVSRNLAGRDLDLDDPEDNVVAGVLFLDYLHGLTGGDAERTLAGYYQGLASVARYGMFDSTERYIDNVLALRDRFR
jgi:N-acetylmuramoyl-L-alanine amidase